MYGSTSATLRPIEVGDDAVVAEIIRSVLKSYGLTGCDSAFGDAEIDSMSQAYPGGRARYFVLDLDGAVVGGAGFGPLASGGDTTCELRKMYLRPEVRGRGYGRRLLSHVLEEARSAGYQICYLETVPKMVEAQRLYESLGFRRLSAPMGRTGHSACDVWYAREL